MLTEVARICNCCFPCVCGCSPESSLDQPGDFWSTTKFSLPNLLPTIYLEILLNYSQLQKPAPPTTMILPQKLNRCTSKPNLPGATHKLQMLLTVWNWSCFHPFNPQNWTANNFLCAAFAGPRIVLDPTEWQPLKSILITSLDSRAGHRTHWVDAAMGGHLGRYNAASKWGAGGMEGCYFRRSPTFGHSPLHTPMDQIGQHSVIMHHKHIQKIGASQDANVLHKVNAKIRAFSLKHVCCWM